VLIIDRGIFDGIMAHARRDHPEEACGVVAGPIGSDRPERLIPMDNAERSMTFYRFDAMEQLRVWRVDGRPRRGAGGDLPLTYCHRALPSRTDISFAGEPGAHYVLVSTREPTVDEIRSFRIVDGEVTEEPVRVIGASVDGGPAGSPDAVTTYMFGQTQNNVDYECPA